ncbi:MATE family efflux transporter [Clostridium butanoliproducens]|uniref:MATE family efflux transporter n=1 Tax=Clostridium butanoliproducens TaxID=2991837 RepID=UPI0024BB2911|nr:MATE family efflux transporter [Clostridium butanoliproducens]MDU1347893.1 MATE family efflux transporter [Clostridium argentinense]
MRNDLIKDSTLSLFFKFVIPSIVGILVNSLYLIIDGIFIGRGVGEIALASINIIFPAACANMAVGSLFGTGAATLISIRLGENKREEAKDILGTSIFIMILISTVISIVGIIFLEPIMRFLGAEGEVLILSKQYGTILFLVTPFHVLATGLNPITRSDGNPKLSMNILIIASILNVFLDWLFVIKLNLGIIGAGCATAIGIIGSSIYLLFYFFSKQANIRIKLSYLKIKLKLLREVFVSGFMSFAMQVALAFIIFIQNQILLSYGSTLDVSIFAIVGYISIIFIQILYGIAQGIQPIIGYNYGANEYGRVRQILKISLIADVIFGHATFIFVYVFSRKLVGIFNSNPEVIKLAARRLVIYLASMPTVGIVITFASYFQATKRNLFANILSVGRSFVLLIPISFILPHFMGVDGVFLAPVVADYIGLIVTIFICINLKRNSSASKNDLVA